MLKDLPSRENNITNTTELNCLVTLVKDGFQRIGYENLYQCPVEISIWYLDYRNSPCIWSNRSKNAREIKGDFTCQAVTIGRNAEFMLLTGAHYRCFNASTCEQTLNIG